MYRYFVSYAHRKGNGCSVISLASKIKSIENVKEVVKLVEEYSNAESVVILNFILLED